MPLYMSPQTGPTLSLSLLLWLLQGEHLCDHVQHVCQDQLQDRGDSPRVICKAKVRISHGELWG